MAQRYRVISSRLIGVRTFREDLQALLELSAEQLKHISQIADSEGGFSYAEQLGQLTPELLSTKNLAGALRAASYLYDRVHELELSPKDAISEINTLLPALNIKTLEGKEEALENVLHLKPKYEETSGVEERAVTVVPHYSDVRGICDIRPIFDRRSQHVVKRVPVVLLTLFWHDDSGNSSQTTVQLLAEDWERFRQKIEKLDRELGIVSEEV